MNGTHTRFPDGTTEHTARHPEWHFLGHSFTFNDWDVLVHDTTSCSACERERASMRVEAAVIRSVFPPVQDELPFE